ncbi:TonB-dependent receptor [Thalassotalea profundi]|uniref:TonB-dependent receptor n=1 Tax=Thalassotalea profundi TaxID=2036687 RepID=A0ABQ3IRA7_9GAMM|nr:TonB-dependent siderophore receptor [Thalassotalea profundi]GHE88975.1 TonB-dependent receptor [Thalassotalea profundi]
MNTLMSLSNTLKLIFPMSLLSLSINTAFAENAETTKDKETTEVIEVVGQASQVDLTKRFAGGQVARGGRVGIFGNIDFLDTPFSGTAYTSNLISEQQAQNIGDILQNDPTVRVTKGFGNFQEVYMLRGFPVFSDDITLNGAFGILPRQFIAAELLERVEVLRGANSFVNGAAPGGSGVGGSINLVPKRAPIGGIKNATIGYDASNQLSGAVDVGTRFGDANEWGIRVNGVLRDGEGAITDQKQNLSVLSLGIDYASDNARFSADIGYQDNHIDAPRPQVTPLGDVPEAPDADTNFAQRWTFSDEQQLFGVVRGEYDLDNNSSVWLGAGFRSGDENNDLANPKVNADGSGTAIHFANVRDDSVYSIDGGVKTEFTLAGIPNRLVLSGAIVDSESKNAFAFADFGGFAVDIYNPVQITPPVTDVFLGGDMENPTVTEKVNNKSIAIANTMSFVDETVLATVGLRHQSIKTQSFDATSGVQTGIYDDSKVTPVFALLYKVSEQFSVYGNYAESLQPGATAPNVSNGLPVSNAGEVLEPFTGEQVELGLKYDGGKIGATANIFSLNRPNAVITNQVFSASGEQQSTGMEITVFGEPIEGLRIIGGGTYVDAELAKTQGNADEGNTPIGIPELQTNINIEWDIASLPGLTLDSRVIYTSEQYIDTANTKELDSWTRLDIGARYAFDIGDTSLNVKARINNLTDNNYWSSTGGYPGANYLILSEPRSVAISVSFDF